MSEGVESVGLELCCCWWSPGVTSKSSRVCPSSPRVDARDLSAAAALNVTATDSSLLPQKVNHQLQKTKDRSQGFYGWHNITSIARPGKLDILPSHRPRTRSRNFMSDQGFLYFCRTSQ